LLLLFTVLLLFDPFHHALDSTSCWTVVPQDVYFLFVAFVDLSHKPVVIWRAPKMIRPTQFNKWTNRTLYHHNPRRMTNRRATRSAKKGGCRANNRCTSISQSGVIQSSYCFIWLKSGNWTLTSGSFNSHTTKCVDVSILKKIKRLAREIFTKPHELRVCVQWSTFCKMPRSSNTHAMDPTVSSTAERASW